MASRDMSVNGNGFARVELEPTVYNQGMRAMNEVG
jgi:hypothetical protein